MKKPISIVTIAALFAVGTAFTASRQVQNWNVDHPQKGTPGIVWLSYDQVKGAYCPGLNNVECAYLIGSPGTYIKKP